MTNSTHEQVIEANKKWLTDVVVGCNFCPFAGREVKRNSIHYQVETGTTLETGLQALMKNVCGWMMTRLLKQRYWSFPMGFAKFEAYHDLVDLAEKLLKKENMKVFTR